MTPFKVNRTPPTFGDKKVMIEPSGFADSAFLWKGSSSASFQAPKSLSRVSQKKRDPYDPMIPQISKVYQFTRNKQF